MTIQKVDTEDDSLLSFTGSVTVPREPDGALVLPNGRIATANEGDLFGGSRHSPSSTRRDTSASTAEFVRAPGCDPWALSRCPIRRQRHGTGRGRLRPIRKVRLHVCGIGARKLRRRLPTDGVEGPQKFAQFLPAGWGPRVYSRFRSATCSLSPVRKTTGRTGSRSCSFSSTASTRARPNTRTSSQARTSNGRTNRLGRTVRIGRRSRQQVKALRGVGTGSSPKRAVSSPSMSPSARPGSPGLRARTGGSGNYDPEGIAANCGRHVLGRQRRQRLGFPPEPASPCSGPNGAVLQEVGLPAEILDCRGRNCQRGDPRQRVRGRSSRT